MGVRILSLLLGFTTWGYSALHPSLVAKDLNLNGIYDLTAAHGVVGLDFLSDGRLVVCTWGGNRANQDSGKVIILSNVLKEDVTISAEEIATGLRDPLGMTVVEDMIYVSVKQGILKIHPESGEQYLITEVYNSGDYHEFHFSLMEKEGFLYSTLGQVARPRHEPERGGVLKTNLSTGESEIIAGGLREANGIGLGTGGEIFMSDNQGHWLPTSKIMHLGEGRFYGYDNNLGPFFGPLHEQHPPVVWLEHIKVAQSPTQPATIRHGIFKGQMYLGDFSQCRILRVFAERVNGVWQGAVFFFGDSEGLTSSPNRFVYGPEGNLWAGGMPGGNGWNSKCGEESFITKFTPTPEVTFEMQAVRSLADGFEIEFTAPAGDAAAQVGNYSLERWAFRPVYAYGGSGAQDKRNVNISSAELSPDKMKVTLKVDPIDLNHSEGDSLIASTQFYFKLNNILSASGENLYSNETWYTLNEIGPATLGCMAPGDENYNPAADYDDGFQCSGETTGTQSPMAHNLWSINSNTLTIRGSSQYSIEIFDLLGKTVYTINGTGRANHNLGELGLRGIHFMAISMENKTDILKALIP